MSYKKMHSFFIRKNAINMFTIVVNISVNKPSQSEKNVE